MTQSAISVSAEHWPIRGTFTIARGSKTSADVVVVTVRDGDAVGIGECLPYPRYDESQATTIATIEEYARAHGGVPTRTDLLRDLPAGAARNALDCALWDLESRQQGRPVWELAGLPPPEPVATAYTLGIADTDTTELRARENAWRPLLKVKLGGGNAAEDGVRLQAARRGAPDTRLIVDVNEGWSKADLVSVAEIAHAVGVELIEQPLPADEDSALEGYSAPVPLGADESVHGEVDLQRLAKRYSTINVKLDKTGGLTAAIELVNDARAAGLDIMIGCMVATSLSMAPALLLASSARFVDLDGPLLLERDRQPGLVYEAGTVAFPAGDFWGNRTVLSAGD